MHAPCIVGVPVESEDACPMHPLHTGGVRGCMPHASFASNGPRYDDRPVLHARHADNSIGPRVPSPPVTRVLDTCQFDEGVTASARRDRRFEIPDRRR